MTLTEHGLQDKIRDAVGRFPTALLRRRQVGVFLAISGDLKTAIKILASCGISARVVRVGDTGEADLQGIAHGRPVAVEVKKLGGELSPDQERWGQMVWRRAGGLYVVGQHEFGERAHAPAVERVLRELGL